MVDSLSVSILVVVFIWSIFDVHCICFFVKDLGFIVIKNVVFMCVDSAVEFGLCFVPDFCCVILFLSFCLMFLMYTFWQIQQIGSISGIYKEYFLILKKSCVCFDGCERY